MAKAKKKGTALRSFLEWAKPVPSNGKVTRAHMTVKLGKPIRGRHANTDGHTGECTFCPNKATMTAQSVSRKCHIPICRTCYNRYGM